MPHPRIVIHASAAARLAAAREHLAGLPAGVEVLIVGASRAAADELAIRWAAERGGTFGVHRAGLSELVAKLAMPVLARDRLTPTAPLGEEALAARVVFDAAGDGALRYFAPVAGMPGFPRALGRTLSELRMAGVESERMTGPGAAGDLALLLDRSDDERRRAGAVDYATMLETAADVLNPPPARLGATAVILLDVPINSVAEQRFVAALVRAVRSMFATVPSGDARSIAVLEAIAGPGDPKKGSPPPVQGAVPGSLSALSRLQRWLFSTDTPPTGSADESVVVFSAPGEGREAVEIARRILQEAARGVPFDEIAVLLRAPQTYLGVLEHALDRAGIPAWFHRGTRRPDPAGRALLALLACAEENLSARRFAEYVSLGQVPFDSGTHAGRAGTSVPADPAAGPSDDPDFASSASALRAWVPPADEIAEAIIAAADRTDDVQPEEERRAAAARGETAQDVAGTLRAPWRWEDLIVEAAVIGGIDRWERRLAGLHHEYHRRLREAESDDPESSRTRGLRRDTAQLAALRAFALPVLGDIADWPGAAPWGEWLDRLRALVPRVIAHPARVLRILQELGPLEAVGPVGLREVRDVLAPRLSTLTSDPPRRRFGRVFVGTPFAARGRAFRVVFVPGLAERMFPQRIREDALLLDDRRVAIGPELATQPARAVEERLQLTLAAGAAGERLYVSFPRIEINESRPRVPSFYVLDIVRAMAGAIPASSAVAAEASRAGAATLAWPAPRDPAVAIDDFEHDLATMGGLLRSESSLVKGRARYLYELSPELQRSLTARWLRWHRRQWEAADGLVRVMPETTAPALARQRLGARPYSLTALQRFSSCPYQFLIGAIYRLAPLEMPAPLQRIDPLTRGDLFHRIQALALRQLQEHKLLPLGPASLATAQKMLEWAVTEVDREAYDTLAPAIERVWRDEIAAMTRDLKIWLERLAEEGQDWTPERFEFAFGLDDTAGRDPLSAPDPAVVDGRFRLRGSIDMVERHRQTGLLRVTDHKTGRNRTTRGQTVVQGGKVLQPVLYGMALEALEPREQVFSGRLFFCTTAGHFESYEIPLALGESKQRGLEVLEIIDRSIEHGLLAARPDRDACKYCDFVVVCGREEERRTRRKDPARFADLDALRKLP